MDLAVKKTVRSMGGINSSQHKNEGTCECSTHKKHGVRGNKSQIMKGRDEVDVAECRSKNGMNYGGGKFSGEGVSKCCLRPFNKLPRITSS